MPAIAYFTLSHSKYNMDIAKYIGLFLLKNKYCYIHGLGNLELKKRAAFHDGTALNAPAYEVIITPGGSIDDTLANFIATNEQISISKASNALRDFSTDAKANLAAGKDVIIPSLGKFIEDNGITRFITDPTLQYTPNPIPTVRSAVKPAENLRPKQEHDAKLPPVAQQIRQAEPQPQPTDYPPYPEPAKAKVNWGKVAIVGGLALLIVVIAIFAIRYVNTTNDSKENASLQESPIAVDTVVAAAPAPPVDTNLIMGADGMLSYKVALKEYNTASGADKRAKQLQSYGYSDVYVLSHDSSAFVVVLPVSSLPDDTTHVLDSLARTLNPSGVSIYR